MNALKNLRIGTRLGAGFALVAALMVAVAVNAEFGMSSIRDDATALLKDRYAKVKVLAHISDDVNLQARAARNLLIMDDAAAREEEIRAIEAAHERVSRSYDRVQAMLGSEQGRVMFAGLLQERAAFVADLRALEAAVHAGDSAGAKRLLLNVLRPHQLSYQKQLADMTAYQETLMEASGASTLATIGRVMTVTLGATALGLVIAIAAGVLVTRSVVRPVREVVGTLRQVADGNLSVDVTVNRGDELGELQRSLAETVAALRHVVSMVRAGIDAVTTASGQIAAGNQDLSTRTEEQASSLQETASSMEELSITVRQSADSAAVARDLATEASAAAERGGAVVGQVVQTMDAITASSRKVVEIISVIDGIAFQTNILALNAAVEAARAGEQGRGFAVVASEVRVLAQRSAEAAKQIKTLIGNSAGRVEAGSLQVADAGCAMSDIVEQVRRVHALIGEIAGTAGEQSRGIDQINHAVTQMDHVTQQNAALVEEGAAAADSLAQQAQALAKVVGAFRLDPAT